MPGVMSEVLKQVLSQVCRVCLPSSKSWRKTQNRLSHGNHLGHGRCFAASITIFSIFPHFGKKRQRRPVHATSAEAHAPVYISPVV